MSGRTALFVRIPAEDAERLDRAAFELKASKQDLVAGLVARYVDPGSAEGLESLRGLAGPVPLGRHEFRPAGAPATPPEVPTLEEAAELLRLGPAAARAAAEAGEIPGRRIGGRWRFSRRRLIAWLEHAGQ
ncbi:MAG TPA: helix-turn-helix domain-containing protein [Miltoncostaeaceae bacterium]|nr:helix-turn-helix domain-containing protein [Miltoncostaeaceae bacterium]